MTSYTVVPNSSIGCAYYLNRWKVMDLLGKGTFTKVISAWDRSTSEYVAIKISSLDEDAIHNAYNEISILDRIANDQCHIIRYKYWFKEDSKGHICIVMPKLTMTLEQYIDEHNRLLDPMLKMVTRQLIHGVSYLHDQVHVIHTDIKPSNILISGISGIDINIKIADFNLSICVDVATEPLTHLITTIFYRSPEVLLNREWSYPTDIWSIGCTIFELATHTVLFPVYDRKFMISYICSVMGPMEDLTDYKNIHPIRADRLHMIHDTNLFDMIKLCLTYDPHSRATISVLVDHPFSSSTH
jgi:serine/threonine protein kinase